MTQIPNTIDELLEMWEPKPRSKSKAFDLELAEKTGKYLCPKHKVLYPINETCPKCIVLWQTGMANQTDPDILGLTDDDYMEL